MAGEVEINYAERSEAGHPLVIYKTPLGDHGKFHMQGQILFNPCAQNPLQDAQVSKIKEGLFH